MCSKSTCYLNCGKVNEYVEASESRESSGDTNSSLSERLFWSWVSLRFVSTHINVIIEQTRNLEMVRYAHEHLHYKFSKGTANVAATTGEVGILKYVLDNGAPVSVYTLRILNARLKSGSGSGSS